MREYLIKLYCTINEIKNQRENSETEKLRKQMEDMRKNMEILQEENRNLKKELEMVKNKINSSSVVESPRNNENT